MRFIRFVEFTLIAGAAVGSLHAQADSRLAEIAAQQDQKAAQAKPEPPGRLERAMLSARDNAWVERVTNGIGGFRPAFGGLAAGNGFGLGTTYSQTGIWNGQLTLKAGARASFRGARKFDLELAAPKLANGRFFTEFDAVRHEYPRMSFYGLGPDSAKSGRTDFRLEDTAVDATFGVRPASHLTLGSSAGYVFNNVGPGTDRRYASTGQVYSPAQAPGIDVQSNFSRAGAFAQYDWRDNPDGPRRGGNYFAQFNDYRERRILAGENSWRLPQSVEAEYLVAELTGPRGPGISVYVKAGCNLVVGVERHFAALKEN